MLLIYCLIAVVLVVLAVAIYSGTGGRAWFGTRERPKKIIGLTVRLTQCDGLPQSSTPAGIITRHDGPNYQVEFSSEFFVDGREQTFAWIRARHVSYPVSGAQRRPTFVNGSLESGRRFIARLDVADEGATSGPRRETIPRARDGQSSKTERRGIYFVRSDWLR